MFAAVGLITDAVARGCAGAILFLNFPKLSYKCLVSIPRVSPCFVLVHFDFVENIGETLAVCEGGIVSLI